MHRIPGPHHELTHRRSSGRGYRRLARPARQGP
jgi:hypothetical protein